MPPYRIEFNLPTDGETVTVESDDGPPSAGQMRVSRDGAVTEHAGIAIQDALRGIKPVAEALMGTLEGLTQTPKQVTAEFGVKLTATAGIVIAKAATEGHVVIKLTWEPNNGMTRSSSATG